MLTFGTVAVTLSPAPGGAVRPPATGCGSATGTFDEEQPMREETVRFHSRLMQLFRHTMQQQGCRPSSSHSFPPPHKHINPRVNERGLNILFHGSHEMTASSSATPCARRHTLKLAINTHVAYQRPLATLFESLVGTGFLSFADVLVLMGGAPHEEPPHMEMLATLLVARGPSAPLATASVVVARTRGMRSTTTVSLSSRGITATRSSQPTTTSMCTTQ